MSGTQAGDDTELRSAPSFNPNSADRTKFRLGR